MSVTIGSDVEFFVKEKASGRIVSAEGYIQGTKSAPHRFDPSEPWFATQLDNVLAEGNIPATSHVRHFTRNLARLRGYIDSVLPAHLTTEARAAVMMEPGFLMTENAQAFGCDPSWNAWTGELEGVFPSHPCLRSAGFHIHIGYDGHNEEQNRKIAQAMDLFLGVPSVLLDPDAKMRRDGGYGAAGNYRNQPHGVEYRTLSSYMASNTAYLEWAFQNTLRAFNAARMGVMNDPYIRDGLAIRDAINGNDTKVAKGLVWRLGIPMPEVP